jgi:hypothetical protein
MPAFLEFDAPLCVQPVLFPDMEITLYGVRKVRVPISFDLLTAWRRAKHFWVFDRRGTGADEGFIRLFLANYPSPTAENLEEFLAKFEPLVEAADNQNHIAARQAEAEYDAKRQDFVPWARVRRNGH